MSPQGIPEIELELKDGLIFRAGLFAMFLLHELFRFKVGRMVGWWAGLFVKVRFMQEQYE